MSGRITVALLLSLLTSVAARGSTITLTGTFVGASGAMPTLGTPVTANLPGFDSTLGTLVSETVTTTFSSEIFVNVYNVTSVAQSFTGAKAWTTLPGVTYTDPFGGSVSQWVGNNPNPLSGTVNANSIGYFGVPSSTVNTSLVTVITGSNLSTYSTGASLNYAVTGTIMSSIIAPAGVFVSGNVGTDGTVSVTYDYAPIESSPVPAPSAFLAALLGIVSLAGTSVVCRRWA